MIISFIVTTFDVSANPWRTRTLPSFGVAASVDAYMPSPIGVNAPRIKRDIYMISAFLTALAGTFYVQYIYFIDPATAFSFNISIEAALVSIVGNAHEPIAGIRLPNYFLQPAVGGVIPLVLLLPVHA